jgi:hypothetical protein
MDPLIFLPLCCCRNNYESHSSTLFGPFDQINRKDSSNRECKRYTNKVFSEHSRKMRPVDLSQPLLFPVGFIICRVEMKQWENSAGLQRA